MGNYVEIMHMPMELPMDVGYGATTSCFDALVESWDS
jgi:hypothetical protein